MVELFILFIVSFVAATISGVAGFGGAMILLPFLNYLVGIKSAVPILTIAQLWGNLSRVFFGRNELQWKPIVFFLVTAIPSSILGSYLFVGTKTDYIKIGIGVFLILLVLYRRLNIKKITLGDKG
ncbi:MAG: sulfite exporter TauE/SafE family protein, partial [Bacteroidia bacterium]|nr:sulfite exporter TauE/SafE family protein [Bacteroidia bacterium]